MEETIIKEVNPCIESLGVFVDSVKLETEGNINYLRIALDAEFLVDLNTCVCASRIINPIIDKMNLDLPEYILDIYGKSKGEN